MSPALLLPIAWPLAAACISLCIPRGRLRLRNGFVWAALGLELFCMALLCAGALRHPAVSIGRVFGAGLSFGADGFRSLYGLVSAFLFFMAGLFTPWYLSHSHARRRYDCAMLLTLSGVMGVFLSEDLYTLFLFFELMSFSSYLLVLHEETPAAMQAAKTYLAVSVAGGLLLLLGIVLLQGAAGTISLSALTEAVRQLPGGAPSLYPAGLCMLLGFGAKAGMFPVHFWLAGAHGASPAPASALLSGILTKTGIFGILVLATRIFCETFSFGVLLVILGAIGMLLGALRALFSVDLKRTLAFSSVSQIGFILLGVGLQVTLGHHNALAVRGTVLHMLNHSLIKLVLFLSAGVVLHNTRSLHLSEIQGFGRGKGIFTFAFLMGALGISGVPLWNGYISKTLLHDAILEQIAGGHAAMLFHCVEWLFLLAGGITCAYMAKLFFALCVQKGKPASGHGSYLSPLGKAVLLAGGLLLPALGMNPGFMMDGIGRFAQDFLHGQTPAHAPHFFSWHAMQGGAVSLGIGALLYLLLVRRVLMRKSSEGGWIYLDRWPAWLELEGLLYRPLMKAMRAAGGAIARIVGSVPSTLGGAVACAFLRLRAFWVSRAARIPGTSPGIRARYAQLAGRAHDRFAGLGPQLLARYRSLSQALKSETAPFWEGDGELLSGVEAAHTKKLPREDTPAPQEQPCGRDEHAR